MIPDEKPKRLSSYFNKKGNLSCHDLNSVVYLPIFRKYFWSRDGVKSITEFRQRRVISNIEYQYEKLTDNNIDLILFNNFY